MGGGVGVLNGRDEAALPMSLWGVGFRGGGMGRGEGKTLGQVVCVLR